MSDQQFANLMEWIGDAISSTFAWIGNGLDRIPPTHWMIIGVIAVVIGFMALKGLRADQRI